MILLHLLLLAVWTSCSRSMGTRTKTFRWSSPQTSGSHFTQLRKTWDWRISFLWCRSKSHWPRICRAHTLRYKKSPNSSKTHWSTFTSSTRLVSGQMYFCQGYSRDGLLRACLRNLRFLFQILLAQLNHSFTMISMERKFELSNLKLTWLLRAR